jgi:hypothetical protein
LYPPPPVFSLSKIVFTTLLALSLVLSLALTACGGGGGGGGGGGAPTSISYTGQDGTYSYKLTISKPRAVYDPAEGDDFTLIVYEGTTGSGTEKSKSTGKINKTNATTFKLTGTGITGTITVTVNGGNITSIEGAITIDGQTFTFPGDLTPITGGNTPGGNDKITGKWKKATTINYEINGIAFDGSKFVAVGASNTAHTSADGINWTAVSNAFPSGYVSAIVYAEDKNMFVAGGVSGKVWTSTDGTSWTSATISSFGTSDSVDLIAYGGGRFVAGSGTKLAYSSDGTNWTAGTITTGASDYIEGIAWGNGKFIAVGGEHNTDSDGWTTKEKGKIWTSTDGSTWTAMTSPFGTSYIEAIAYGNGKFVALGNDFDSSSNKPAAYLSDSAAAWTSVSPVPVNGGKIAFCNNIFIAGTAIWGSTGVEGGIRTSADGTTWSALYEIDSSSSKTFSIIAYGNNTYVMACPGGYNATDIYYSTGL